MPENIHDINRKFERFLPEVAADEARHYQTTLAEGRERADRERRHRQEERQKELSRELKREEDPEWEIYWGTFIYDFENQTETFIPAPTKTEQEPNKDEPT